MSESDLTKCGAFWLKEGKKGKFFSGNIDLSKLDIGPADTVNLLVFRNTRKEKEKHPDYEIFAAAPPRDDSSSRSNEPRRNEPKVDDDVPF